MYILHPVHLFVREKTRIENLPLHHFLAQHCASVLFGTEVGVLRMRGMGLSQEYEFTRRPPVPAETCN